MSDDKHKSTRWPLGANFASPFAAPLVPRRHGARQSHEFRREFLGQRVPFPDDSEHCRCGHTRREHTRAGDCVRCSCGTVRTWTDEPKGLL